MRTTLTIDEDVAVQLKRLCRARDASLKDIVNEALRRGLRDMAAESQARRAVRTRAFPMGKPLINLDNAADALARLEGEGFR